MRLGKLTVNLIALRLSSSVPTLASVIANPSRSPNCFQFLKNSTSYSSIGTQKYTMDAVVDMADAAHALDLDRIRFQLMYAMKTTPLEIYHNWSCADNNSRLEDTITFHLIERVQFALNKVSQISMIEFWPIHSTVACISYRSPDLQTMLDDLRSWRRGTS